MSSPAYRAGVDAANQILDRTPAVAGDVLALAEIACELWHQLEHVYGYHRAKGVLDTMREFLAEKGS
jgi:hypothetical protein